MLLIDREVRENEIETETMEHYTLDNFTPADRRELIEGGVKLAGLKEDMMELKRMIEKGDHAASVGNKELEIRVRTLENFRWWIAGAAGAAGLASGFLSRFIHN